MRISKSLSSKTSTTTLQFREAMARAKDCQRLAAQAENDEDRANYQRLYLKWRGVAKAWLTIASISSTELAID